MQKFLEYFFDSTTPPLGITSYYTAVGIIAFCAAASFVLMWWRQKKTGDSLMRSLCKRLSFVCGAAAVTGVLIIFLRQEQVAVLGARIVFYVWATITAVRIAVPIVKYKRVAPGIREKRQQEMLKKKYLPQ